MLDFKELVSTENCLEICMPEKDIGIWKGSYRRGELYISRIIDEEMKKR